MASREWLRVNKSIHQIGVMEFGLNTDSTKNVVNVLFTLTGALLVVFGTQWSIQCRCIGDVNVCLCRDYSYQHNTFNTHCRSMKLVKRTKQSYTCCLSGPQQTLCEMRQISCSCNLFVPGSKGYKYTVGLVVVIFVYFIFF